MIRKSIKKGLSALLVTVSILSLVGCGGQKTLDGHYTVDTKSRMGVSASTSALFPKSMILRKTETKSP